MFLYCRPKSLNSELSIKDHSWKSLPWGTHACLFYKSDCELDRPFKSFFREGLLNNEKCVWVISKSYDPERAVKLSQELLAETGLAEESFELIRHEDWYEKASGRFRSTNEIVMAWLNKIETAVNRGFGGVRVCGDAHFHPDDLKNFFDYETQVNASIGTLKIKGLCTYCIPKFAGDQLALILNTHQNAFGDFAVSES